MILFIFYAVKVTAEGVQLPSKPVPVLSAALHVTVGGGEPVTLHFTRAVPSLGTTMTLLVTVIVGA